MALSGCGSTSPAPTGTGHAPRTIRVPQNAAGIQAGLAQAQPGDLVLIAAGVYREQVRVSIPGVVVRGVDRNAVILDGENKRANGVLLEGDGDVVENLTVHNFTGNGVLVTGTQRNGFQQQDPRVPTVVGYRVSYVTAYNNGSYGIYAFAADRGQIDHSYTSGHPDSGIYVGQCRPCDTVVTDDVAENNAKGYEGTNAGGNLVVVSSIWRRNRIGMTVTTEDTELLAPQSDAVVAGNLVADNTNAATPPVERGGFGFGIVLGGGQMDTVTRNRVSGNSSAGIWVTNVDTHLPVANTVSENALVGNGVDLAFAIVNGAQDPGGSCFAMNTFGLSSPPGIEAVLPCGGNAGALPATLPSPQVAVAPPGVDYQSMPAPPMEPNMASPATAPARPARGAPPVVDVARVSLPTG